MWFKGLAIRGQDAAFADAVEQQCVDTAFELADAFAHRGLGDVQFFGRERKRFELGDGEKGLDLIDLHVVSDLVVPILIFRRCFSGASIPKGNANNENYELVLF